MENLNKIIRERKVGKRKIILFVCATIRVIGTTNTDKRTLRGIEALEAYYTNGTKISKSTVTKAYDAFEELSIKANIDATNMIMATGQDNAESLKIISRRSQAEQAKAGAVTTILHKHKAAKPIDIVNDTLPELFLAMMYSKPPHPISKLQILESLIGQNDITIPQNTNAIHIALQAYNERLPDGSLDPVVVNVLADSLADIGIDTGIESYLRSKSPKYIGDYVVDAVLGFSIYI